MNQSEVRECTTCKKPMKEGYVAEDGSYGCSDECWFVDGYSHKQYQADYEKGVAYWTEWESYYD